jgi:ferredoxin-type protein NapH
MMVSKLRLITQHLLFLVLTYGGRGGIHLGNVLPCFSCPYVSGCGGNCYLMAIQGHWWGLQMPLVEMISTQGMEALTHLGLFIVLIILLNKFWCGWICPFGTVQDWLTLLRKRLALREAQFSWLTRDRLKPVKYILLAYLLIVPLLIAHTGLHPDFSLPFCQICPAKPLMPLFVGETRHLALDFTNSVTLVFSILSITIAAGMLVGMFFKERFFCLFCPLLVLIHIFRTISPVRFEKKVEGCLGCGNCQRVCPMDIRTVHEQKTEKEVLSEDCLLCMTCTESCPADGVLTVKFFKWRLFSSSRAYVSRHFLKKRGSP